MTKSDFQLTLFDFCRTIFFLYKMNLLVWFNQIRDWIPNLYMECQIFLIYFFKPIIAKHSNWPFLNKKGDSFNCWLNPHVQFRKYSNSVPNPNFLSGAGDGNTNICWHQIPVANTKNSRPDKGIEKAKFLELFL